MVIKIDSVYQIDFLLGTKLYLSGNQTFFTEPADQCSRIQLFTSNSYSGCCTFVTKWVC